MNIEDMEGLDEATRKEIEELQKVTRERDGSEAYALAQFDIGKRFEEIGIIEKALESWGNIEKSDSKKGYSIARFRIGQALRNQGNIEVALEVWRSIERIDSPQFYAAAHNSIGTILEEKGDIEGSLKAWYKIRREDDLKEYVSARQSIGWALNTQGDTEGALSVWASIKREDDLEGYASVKLMSGWILEDQGRIDRALEFWCDVQRTDDSKWYASAKTAIGQALIAKMDIEGALEAWGEIERIDDPESYAFAQRSIGWILDSQGDTIRALKAWQNIEITDSKYFFAYAQFDIATKLIHGNINSDIENAKDSFQSASEFFPYEAYCYKKICNLILKVKTKKVGIKALQLLDNVLKIVKILKLDFGQNSNEDKSPERKLAHYTGTYTTNKLLAKDEETNSSSAFRLNTINNVNDPSEGQLLANYLKNTPEKLSYASGFDGSLHAFISCFTFNHDSLNQFRLYGKQDNKEASGVSLVFKKEFFQSNNLSGGLSFIPLKNNYQSLDNNTINHTEQDSASKNRIGKQPVMRCVYFDPISGFAQLAQRNKLTFYREFGSEKVRGKSKAEIEWEKYKDSIDKKTREFNEEFISLKKVYRELNEEKSILEEMDLDNIEVLLNEILLPLKYLIKHSAFQEEQECRMVYITSLNEPEVIMDFGQFLYVEYEPEVKTHLDKVYIAPAATKYQPYLDKLLCENDARIELSNNPYRQT